MVYVFTETDGFVCELCCCDSVSGASVSIWHASRKHCCCVSVTKRTPPISPAESCGILENNSEEMATHRVGNWYTACLFKLHKSLASCCRHFYLFIYFFALHSNCCLFLSYSGVSLSEDECDGGQGNRCCLVAIGRLQVVCVRFHASPLNFSLIYSSLLICQWTIW